MNLLKYLFSPLSVLLIFTVFGFCLFGVWITDVDIRVILYSFSLIALAFVGLVAPLYMLGFIRCVLMGLGLIFGFVLSTYVYEWHPVMEDNVAVYPNGALCYDSVPAPYKTAILPEECVFVNGLNGKLVYEFFKEEEGFSMLNELKQRDQLKVFLSYNIDRAFAMKNATVVDYDLFLQTVLAKVAKANLFTKPTLLEIEHQACQALLTTQLSFETCPLQITGYNIVGNSE